MRKLFTTSATLFTVTLLASCSGGDDHKSSFDAKAIMAKMGGSIGTHRGSTLAISPDGQFDLTYDTTVRYFPENAPTRKNETDARCSLAISGSLMVGPGNSDELSRVAFYVEKASVNAAEVYRNDVLTQEPKETCEMLTRKILEQKGFTQILVETADNYLLFTHFSFNVETPDRGGYLFNAYPHVPFDKRSFHTRDHHDLTYFMKPGTKLDYTATALKDLQGSFVSKDFRVESLELQIDAAQNLMVFTDSNCGLKYEVAVNAITLDSDGMTLKGTPKKVAGNEDEGKCLALIEAMRGFKNPIAIGYAAHYRTIKSEDVSLITFEFPTSESVGRRWPHTSFTTER